jgi:hypothetical protein
MFRKAFIPTLIVIAALAPAAPAGGGPGQDEIALPPEFRPEGIASGKGDRFFVGSIPQASVYSGSFKTGQGSVLVPPHPGRAHIGLKASRGKLFVAGGPSKGVYVYDSRTGADVASYSLPDAGFINDVVVTRRAAYFTDSQVAQLYRVRIHRDGTPGALTRIPLTGDLKYLEGFNLNGIESTGKRLIVVQSNTGKLFSVKPGSGRTREIVTGAELTMGDGLLLRGRRLYVVRNTINEVAVVKLGRKLRAGRVKRVITDDRFDVPTTLAAFKQSIYAVNARFDRPDTEEDDIVRLKR